MAAAGARPPSRPSAPSSRPPPPRRPGPRRRPPAAGPAAAALPAATRSVLEPLSKADAGQAGRRDSGAARSRPSTGEPFYAFQIVRLSAENDAPLPSAMKFGGVVTKEDGQEATSFWEDAPPADMKGTRTAPTRSCDHSIVAARPERIAARSVSSPPTARRRSLPPPTTFKIPEKPNGLRGVPADSRFDADAADQAPQPDGSLRVRHGEADPRRAAGQPASSRREDGLWYFYTVANPIDCRRTRRLRPLRAAPGAPRRPRRRRRLRLADAAPKPRVMTRIGVLKDGTARIPAGDAPAELQPLGPELLRRRAARFRSRRSSRATTRSR